MYLLCAYEKYFIFFYFPQIEEKETETILHTIVAFQFYGWSLKLSDCSKFSAPAPILTFQIAFKLAQKLITNKKKVKTTYFQKKERKDKKNRNFEPLRNRNHNKWTS